MIHEVDEVLKVLLSSGALAGSGIDVAFDAPTRDWTARRNAPTINAYLYDIREDVNRRQRGHIPVRDERDVVVKHRQPPRWFRLSYLVTAWSRRLAARRCRNGSAGMPQAATVPARLRIAGSSAAAPA